MITFSSLAIWLSLKGCLQADALDLDASVQETLERSAGTDAQLSDIKALLGRMMFTGKSVHKKVGLAAWIQEGIPSLWLGGRSSSILTCGVSTVAAVLSH